MATLTPIVLGSFKNSGSGSYLFTTPIGTNYFDSLLLCIACTQTVNTVTDTQGNVYTQIGTIANQSMWLSTGAQPLQQNVAKFIIGVSSSSNNIAIVALNLPGPNVVDLSETASGSGTNATMTTGSINFTDDPNELCISFLNPPAGVTANWSGNLNEPFIPLAAYNSVGSAGEILLGFGTIVPSGQTPLAILTHSESWNMLTCTFATRDSGAMNIIPTIPNTVVSTGVTAPGTFVTLASLTLTAGTYTIPWTVSLGGAAPGSNEINNFQLSLTGIGLPSGGYLTNSSNSAVSGTHPQPSVTFTVPAGDTGTLLLQSSSNSGTSGVIYGGSLTGPWPSVPTITQLNQLSYATSFLVNCAIRPAWHVYKKLVANLTSGNWGAPAYGNVAFDSDKVTNTNSAVFINTQGVYLTENCIQILDTGSTFEWATAFQITAGFNNPHLSQGSTRWYGYRAASTSSINGQNDAFTCTDVTPFCLYPGDFVTPIAWANTNATLEPLTQINFMTGFFAFNFTGYWLNPGP